MWCVSVKRDTTMKLLKPTTGGAFHAPLKVVKMAKGSNRLTGLVRTVWKTQNARRYVYQIQLHPQLQLQLQLQLHLWRWHLQTTHHRLLISSQFQVTFSSKYLLYLRSDVDRTTHWFVFFFDLWLMLSVYVSVSCHDSLRNVVIFKYDSSSPHILIIRGFQTELCQNWWVVELYQCFFVSTAVNYLTLMFLVLVVVTITGLFWLLFSTLFIRNLLRYSDVCPCWDTNKDLEPPAEDPKFNGNLW